MPRQEFRELNGLRAHLLVWPGPAGAPTVVLLHGFLDLAWSFAPFADALQARFPCEIVALDLRGHGRSEWIGRGGHYHFADDVADVHALVSSLEGPVFLLGHSMGGSIAVLFAGAFPEPLPFVLEQFRVFLRRLACPTLLVEGAERGFRQFIDDGRAAEIRGGQHHEIAGAGHMVHQDQPEALAEAEAGFFAAE